MEAVLHKEIEGLWRNTFLLFFNDPDPALLETSWERLLLINDVVLDSAERFRFRSLFPFSLHFYMIITSRLADSFCQVPSEYGLFLCKL